MTEPNDDITEAEDAAAEDDADTDEAAFGDIPDEDSGEDSDEASEEEEAAEGKPSGRFRVSLLHVASLSMLLFFGGIVGWLLMAEEKEAARMESDIVAFETALPPEIEEPASVFVNAGPGDRMADGSGTGSTPGQMSESAMVNGDGMRADIEDAILPPARFLPRAFLEKEMAVLTPSPDPELVEVVEDGLLPIVSKDGRMSLRVYARPFDQNDERPRIAIVVQNMGLSHSATETAIQQLPGSITLAFSPYADNLDHWIAAARKAGHEVLLALPMEPVNYPLNDPGPYALITGLDPAQNTQRLQWLLSRFTGYVGVTNEMGSRFTTSNQDIRPILEIFHKRGLMFVDSRVTSRSVAIRVAEEVGLPWAVSDRSIDRIPSRRSIDRKLAEIERIALDKGTAVAMAFPYPVTFERLALWLPKLEKEGFAVAPISAVVNRQEPQ